MTTKQITRAGARLEHKRTSAFWLALSLAGAFATVAAPAVSLAQDHTLVTPGEIEWAPGPPSSPEGAEAAVLYGNPAEEGVFALRLRLPDGYHLAPHIHPEPEIVTVVSGTFHLGMGETANQDDTEALEPGAFFAFPPGMTHYAYAEGETVIQLNSTGPWSLEYVNPEDDPRS
jgi:quercetin dioxygenase-like cupin family protein